MKPVSEKLSEMDKQKTAPVIHERPKMPRATWEALRNHIIKERKRKQDEEGKAEEYERLKREREHKKKQEANSLEETKEQISKLEEKLTSFKEDKHQLFLTLKKVLNEDETRRRKETSELNILYPQHGTPPVFPLSGHMAPNNPQLTAMYMQPQSRQPAAMYLKPHSLPPAMPPAQPIKRQRTPSPTRSQQLASSVSSAYYRSAVPITAPGGRISTSSVYGHPSAAASGAPIYAMSSGSSAALHYPGASPAHSAAAREEQERRQHVYLSAHQAGAARYVASINQQIEASAASGKPGYSDRDRSRMSIAAPAAHSGSAQSAASATSSRGGQAGSITSGFPVQRAGGSYPGTTLATAASGGGHSLPPRLAYTQAQAAAQLAASQQAAAAAAAQPSGRYYSGPLHGREG